MAEVKAINLHKRRAMGENVSGLKKGGAVRESCSGGMMKKKGGKVMPKKGKC